MADLESVLKQQLRRVNAPVALRELVHRPPAPRKPRRGVVRLVWAAAAVLLAASSAAALHAYVANPPLSREMHASDAVRFPAWVIHAACRLCHDGEEQITASN